MSPVIPALVPTRPLTATQINLHWQTLERRRDHLVDRLRRGGLNRDVHHHVFGEASALEFLLNEYGRQRRAALDQVERAA